MRDHIMGIGRCATVTMIILTHTLGLRASYGFIFILSILVMGKENEQLSYVLKHLI
jgi:hypothetical protein